MRIVIDTNVVVSAAMFASSPPRRALDEAIERGVLLASAETLAELDNVLRRKRLDKFVDLETRLELLGVVALNSELVEVREAIQLCRDPRDDMYLELAASGSATHIISGDQDLLVLHPFRHIPILTPAAFLALITPTNPDRDS